MPNAFLFQDLASVIRRTAKFLGKTLTEEKVAALVDHLSFNKMKENPAVNYKEFTDACKKMDLCTDDQEGTFLRKGEVNNWKNYMSPEMSARFDRWTEENLKGSSFSFEV